MSFGHRDAVGVDSKYVSRGGPKLAHALIAFEIAPADKVCADLGSNVGGFVDCLLRNGAARVYSIDTGRGVLDWTLRQDARVVVMERTNALDVCLAEQVQLVTADVGWTRQHIILPRAMDLLDRDGVIVSLIKPHYEADRRLLRRGVLPDERAWPVVQETLDRLASLGIVAGGVVESPIRGDRGNREWLAMFAR